MALSIIIPFFIGGCVTKGRFESQLAETQSLSERLENQTRKGAMLEEEISRLKRQLKITESDLAETRKTAAEHEATLGNRIGVLEEQLTLSKDMGNKTEKQLKDKMIQLKGEYETDLRKKKQEISTLETGLADRIQANLALQDRLADLKEEISHLEQALSGKKQQMANLQGKLSGRQREISELQKKLTSQKQEISELQNRLNKQFDEISNRETELESMTQIVDKVRERFQVTQEEAAQRERELRESNKAREDLVNRLQKEISEGSIKISQIKDRLTVEIVDKILFASGSSDVTNKGKAVLAKVSAVLKDVRENDIRIEGHTDNVPIGPRIKDKFPTNWELSTSRATQVVRFLSEQGVDPNNLIALGLSQYRPVASNETTEGKQRNRRIEIVLFPRDIQKIASAGNPS